MGSRSLFRFFSEVGEPLAGGNERFRPLGEMKPDQVPDWLTEEARSRDAGYADFSGHPLAKINVAAS